MLGRDDVLGLTARRSGTRLVGRDDVLGLTARRSGTRLVGRAPALVAGAPGGGRVHTPASRLMTAVFFAVARRPGLWVTAVRQGWRLVPQRWWRRRPFLPVPSRQYLEFRLLTQYGDNVRRPQPEDVLNYLRWCRDWERLEQ